MIDAAIFDTQTMYDKLYEPIPKFYEFFAAEHHARKLLWLGGNRTRKTSSIARGISYHLRGWYPDDWPGYRFNRPITAFVSTIVMEKTIGVLQKYFLEGDPQRGLTPCIHKSLISGYKRYSGDCKGFKEFLVKSKSFGYSTLKFGAFEQGARNSQSDTYDIVWLDEASIVEYYTELNFRTTAFSGNKTFLYSSMWPEKGRDEVVARFLSNADAGEAKNHHFYMKSSWSDNPTLTEEEKDLMRMSCPPWQLEAREHGTPVFGHGKVFLMSEKEVFIKKVDLPQDISKFAYLYGLDPSSTSGGTWGMVLAAHDRDNDIVYIIKNYKKRDLTPIEHGYNILSLIPEWGPPGINDYSGGGEDMHNKESTIDFLKRKCGLDLNNADKRKGRKEGGIDEIYMRVRSGKFKIVEDECPLLVEEWRGLARDDKGKIIKENDHCIDSLLYLINKLSLAKTERELSEGFYQNENYNFYNYSGEPTGGFI